MKKSKEDYFWEIVKILKKHDSTRMSTETYNKFMNLFSGSAIGVGGSRIVFFWPNKWGLYMENSF